LVNVRQIPSLGFLNSQLRNIGELRNMGIELSVNGTILRGERFGWDLGASVYTNSSKVLDLGGAPEFSLGDFGWVVEGQPVPVIRADCVANAEKREEPAIEPNCNIGPNLPTHTFVSAPRCGCRSRCSSSPAASTRAGTTCTTARPTPPWCAPSAGPAASTSTRSRKRAGRPKRPRSTGHAAPSPPHAPTTS